MESKKRILLVDDDPRITDLLSDFCSDLGFEVKAINDSREALKTAVEWKPNLITLDLQMPHKDGLEVLQEFSRNSELRAVPVIIISCLAREASITAELVRGIYEKPINFKALI